ncbi:MAG: PEP-CTERM sorting domain-containing protein [Crocosphaera sp.]
MFTLKLKNLPSFLIIGLGLLVSNDLAISAEISSMEIVDKWQPIADPIYNLNGANWAVFNDTTITNDKNNIGTDKPGWSRWVTGSLISDFSTEGDFSFSGSFYSRNDNDGIGLLAFYQDNQNHIRVGWDGRPAARWDDTIPVEGLDTCQLNDSGLCFDHPDNELGLYVVMREDGSETVLFYEETYWQQNTLYDFSINVINSHLSVSVNQKDTSILDTSFSSLPFSSGHIGFRTVNQEVFYSDISYNQAVPEPLTILGAGTATIFGATFKRKLSQTKKKLHKTSHL